ATDGDATGKDDAQAPAPAAPPADAAGTAAAPRAARQPEWEDDPDHRNAARIARVMVADLVLYHKDLIERGVREGTFQEILSRQLEESRKTYDSRVAAKVRDQWDYLAEALSELVARKRRELGLGDAT
ncbi:MAG: hypothetical protein HY906_18040, partial [Deltaproteobacteria bacterium]|nr:hypothetical protein [Deltaproteobacteria bacterium]